MIVNDGNILNTRQGMQTLILSILTYYNCYSEAYNGRTLSELASLFNKSIDAQIRWEEGNGRKLVSSEQRYRRQIVESILKKYPYIGDIILREQSGLLRDKDGNKIYKTGTNAYTFENILKNEIIVAFRGTYIGEWSDNALIILEETTPQLEEALRYVEHVKSRYPDKKIILTGHSKGGNKAQFAYMNIQSDNSMYVISFNAPGFSDALYNRWRESLMLEKKSTGIICINSDSDYVSPIGTGIAKNSNVHIINQGIKTGFWSWHGCEAFFGFKYNNKGERVYNGDFGEETNTPSFVQKVLSALYEGFRSTLASNSDTARNVAETICLLADRITGGNAAGTQGLDAERMIKAFFDFLTVVKNSPGIGIWDVIRIAKQSAEEEKKEKKHINEILTNGNSVDGVGEDAPACNEA